MRTRIVALSIGLLISVCASASAPSPNEDEILAGLLSWAVKLSPYPAPAATPRVEFVSQAFFDENACHHRKCHEIGRLRTENEHTYDIALGL